MWLWWTLTTQCFRLLLMIDINIRKISLSPSFATKISSNYYYNLCHLKRDKVHCHCCMLKVFSLITKISKVSTVLWFDWHNSVRIRGCWLHFVKWIKSVTIAWLSIIDWGSPSMWTMTTSDCQLDFDRHSILHGVNFVCIETFRRRPWSTISCIWHTFIGHWSVMFTMSTGKLLSKNKMITLIIALHYVCLVCRVNALSQSWRRYLLNKPMIIW